MLNLNYLNIDIEKAKTEHFEFFACFVIRKLTGATCQKSSDDKNHPDRIKYCQGHGINNHSFKYRDFEFFKDFVLKNDTLEKILKGSPQTLLEINKDFINLVDNKFGENVYEKYIIKTSENKRHLYDDVPGVHDFFKDINAIFNYDRLSKDKHYSSYKLTENLGVRSCVYCNRMYALTHRKREGGRLLNPQLDHWFPQSKYPLLQISFHNLIPSCDICNSRVKSDNPFDIVNDFHPYQANDEKIEFNYRFCSVESKYKIFFTDNSDPKIRLTSEKMFIDQMYQAHSEELDDLIKIKQAYSDKYLENLKTMFSGLELKDEEIYRLAFSVEIDPKNFHKRPFSKFKYDILKELGIIR